MLCIFSVMACFCLDLLVFMHLILALIQGLKIFYLNKLFDTQL